jgi:hypothetical protein
LTGLLIATFRFYDRSLPPIFAEPTYLVGFLVLMLLAVIIIKLPLSKAGRPEDPAPPAAIM